MRLSTKLALFLGASALVLLAGLSIWLGVPANALATGDGTTTPTATPSGIAPATVTSTTIASPTATQTPGAPSATLTLSGPGAAQPIGVEFPIKADLSDLRFTPAVPIWANYVLRVTYDPTVLSVQAVIPDLCEPANVWATIRRSPDVVSFCLYQNGTAGGTLETITATCLRAGTTVLRFGGADERGAYATDVYVYAPDESHFALTFNDAIVACDASITPAATATSTLVPTPTRVLGSGTPSATFSMSAPTLGQLPGIPFDVTSNLTALALTVSAPSMAGYNFELAYDSSILAITHVAPTLCVPIGVWGNPTKLPTVSTGCYLQQVTSTGVIDTFTMVCLKDGVSALHIFPYLDPDADGLGTEAFDYATNLFALTLEDATVTCDHTADQDGDGCVDAREVLLGLDVSDPWDFYNVPVPALLSGTALPSGYRDRTVSGGDAQAVFAYFVADARVGTTVYDQDRDGNGVADGVQYDRSLVGPAKSGPPDGVVTVRDAQLAFAQYTRGYSC